MKKKLEQKIRYLKVLSEGCRKHPAYRARRPATQRCPDCVVVWEARQKLEAMTC